MVFSSSGKMVTLSIFRFLLCTCLPCPTPIPWRVPMEVRLFRWGGTCLLPEVPAADSLRRSCTAFRLCSIQGTVPPGSAGVRKWRRETVVHFHTSQIMFFHILLGLFDGFLDGQSVQRQITVRELHPDAESCRRYLPWHRSFLRLRHNLLPTGGFPSPKCLAKA